MRNYNLKGGTLLIVIALSLLIIIIMGGFISYNFFANLEFKMYDNNLRLLRNCNSGIQIILNADNLFQSQTSMKIDLFGSGNDSVELKKSDYGFFDIVSSKAFSGNKIKIIVAISGSGLDSISSSAIYLTDRKKALALCGNTVLKGNCYLPKSGVKRSYIEGQNFIGNNLVDGQIKNSSISFPEIKNEKLEYLISLIENINFVNDSLINLEQADIPDSLKNSFNSKQIVLYSENEISISNKNYSGNIVIRSTKGITVNSSSHLRDVILIAPIIIVNDESMGAFQIIANDSIIIGKHCKLAYPTCLGLINKTGKQSIIKVEENSLIEGSIINYSGSFSIYNKTNIFIEKDAVIYGRIFSNEGIQLLGKVIGNVTCNYFNLRTSSSFYENQLLNSTIDATSVSKNLVEPFFFSPSPDSKKIVKWVD